MKPTKKLKSKGATQASISQAQSSGQVLSKIDPKDSKMLLNIYDSMVRARVLEERLIKMYKQNHGYFWLGGPGEEAFNIPLAMQIKKGQGPKYDYMHFHYRAGAIMLVLGMDPKDAMRQMKNTASDPFSGGRNFVSHYSVRDWNVVPVTSTIETQYLTAIGTGIAQKQEGGSGITIVTGGDAGTAEGDFASGLVWCSRPGFELPVLMIVTNNKWGISTQAATQHGEKRVADRAQAFGIKNRTIDGNNVFESWSAIADAMEYVRKERKPFLLEANVSRLYGHSSATGANFINGEEDCLIKFEKDLIKWGYLKEAQALALKEKYNDQMLEMSKQVIEEAMPDPSTIYDHIYYGVKGRVL